MENQPLVQPDSQMHPAHGVLNTPHKPIMRKLESKNNTWMIVLSTIVVVLLGIGTGWFLSGGANAMTDTTTTVSTAQKESMKQSDTEAGIADESMFDKETPIGKLVKGGIDGEGQYHLERDGGPSQNVYLSSTVIDLASFEGKKVQIWGKTQSGKKAGWLMEVGKVKVVE